MANEVAAAKAYYLPRMPWNKSYTSYKFNAYRTRDVKFALRQLADGNCAYCESKIYASGAREVEHFRPKGGIEGADDHPGYWWLASDWENLLPTCRDCNKSLRQHIVTPEMSRSDVEALLSSTKNPDTSYGKANQFEVRGPRAVDDTCDHDAEDPLLIDPCRRDPEVELGWRFGPELTLVAPKIQQGELSPYGVFTIHACALNRAELVIDRIEPLRQMRTLRTKIMEELDTWGGDPGILTQILSQVSTLTGFAQAGQPYIGMAAAYVDEFLDELDRWREARGLPPFA